MFLSLLFSVFIATEHICMKKEGYIYNVSISEHSEVNCAMVGGKTKGIRLIFTFLAVGILSVGNRGG